MELPNGSDLSKNPNHFLVIGCFAAMSSQGQSFFLIPRILNALFASVLEIMHDPYLEICSMQFLIATEKSGYFTVHKCFGVSELTDTPFFWIRRMKNQPHVPPIVIWYKTDRRLDKIVKGWMFEWATNLLSLTSFITLFHRTVSLPTLSFRLGADLLMFVV